MPNRRSSRIIIAAEAAEVKEEEGSDTPLTPTPPPNVNAHGKRLRPRPSENLMPLAPTPIAPARKRAKATTPKSVKRKPRASGSGVKEEPKDHAGSDEEVAPVQPSPTEEEWNDKVLFGRYKYVMTRFKLMSRTCQLNGHQWGTGDFIDVRSRVAGYDGTDGWTARITQIRASSGHRVFCKVDWAYTSHQMLVEAGCRNPPDQRVVQYPSEVVMGQGDALASIISISCINDSTAVAHLDESDPLQDQILYGGSMFYRSFFRPRTEAEIQAEEERIKKKSLKLGTKLYNAKLPVHQFEHPPSCFCKKPYVPLPPGAGAMLYCPRQSCRRWFHTTCIENSPNPKIYGPDIVDELVESGLELLEEDRHTHRQDHLLHSANSDDAYGLPVSYFERYARDERGIPYVLSHAAESSITRGADYYSGIVGTARIVLEARALYRLLLAEYKASSADLPPAETVKKGRRKSTAVKEDPEKLLGSWDPMTRKKLGIWLRLFGGKSEGGKKTAVEGEQGSEGAEASEVVKSVKGRVKVEGGADVKMEVQSEDREADLNKKRDNCWMCPNCQGPI